MSQEGRLLVVKPTLIAKVCRGWPAENRVPPDPDAISAREAMERRQHAKPFSLERTWKVASSSAARSGGFPKSAFCAGHEDASGYIASTIEG